MSATIPGAARPIPGFPCYFVTPDARVFSTVRWRGSSAPRELAQAPNSRGYLYVTLCARDLRVKTGVHVLVAEVFHGARPDGMEVRHLDGDQTNNAATNLAWGTHRQNVRDIDDYGVHYNRAKTHCRRGHPFDDWNTRIAANGGRRICLTCARRKSPRRTSDASGPPDALPNSVVAGQGDVDSARCGPDDATR